MTRINVVKVDQLTDKHCLAEFKEITRPFNKVIKRIENGTMGDVVIPNDYCLGKGHETFFFNKLSWLYERYCDLFLELLDRGFNMNSVQFEIICSNIKQKLGSTTYWDDFNPSTKDIYLNFARLCRRCDVESVHSELKGD